MRNFLVFVTLATGLSGLATAAPAHADDPVVYEVWSSNIPTANVEWSDTAGQHTLQDVRLPWRTSVRVDNAHSAEAHLHADWKPGSPAYPNAGRYLWVTVRIYTKGNLLCEMTVDIGESGCSGEGYYPDLRAPRQN